MLNKSMILSVLLASAQLNAVGFDMENPLSEENKAFTVKLYRTACYAEQQEKRKVGMLSEDAQFQVSLIENEMRVIRSKMSDLRNQIRNLEDSGNEVIAEKDILVFTNYYIKFNDSETRKAMREKAQNLSSVFVSQHNALNVLEDKMRVINGSAPTVLPELGGMDLKQLQSGKNTLRSLVNGFFSRTKEDVSSVTKEYVSSVTKENAITEFLSVVKLGFDEAMIDSLLKKYGEQADKDFEKYYADPCKK